MIKDTATDKTQMIMVEVGDGATEVKSKQYQFFDVVKEKLQEGVLNTPSRADIFLGLQNIRNRNRQRPLNDNGSGFFNSSFISDAKPLPKPDKLTLIRDIVMKASVLADTYEAPTGYTPPVGITNFNIDFYLSLVLLPNTNGNLYFLASGSADNPYFTGRLVSIPFTFNILASSPLFFTISTPIKSFRLSDVIPSRNPVSEAFPDPTKITAGQFNQLITQDSLFSSFFGWNDTQYAALSAANKQLFNELFNGGLGAPPDTFQLFGIGVEITLSYFGIGATFG